MTIQKLIEKYNKLAEKGSVININQVISDLRMIQLGRVRKFITQGDLDRR